MKKPKIKNCIHLIICCIGVFTLSVANGQSSKESKAIATKWIELINKHDSVGLTALYSDDAKIISPNWEGIKVGQSEVRTVFSRYFSSTPDLQYSIDNIIPTDTAVIIEYHFFGKLSNPENTTPDYMRGKKYTLSACTVMAIRKGKIIRQESYFDQVAFLKQMGFFEQK
ncbi:MAG TPA: nuclear transport factor 2 family protein [Puia sp.]|nr:nuclear transport factor 2 family protein [Puia sp.]